MLTRYAALPDGLFPYLLYRHGSLVHTPNGTGADTAAVRTAGLVPLSVVVARPGMLPDAPPLPAGWAWYSAERPAWVSADAVTEVWLQADPNAHPDPLADFGPLPAARH